MYLWEGERSKKKTRLPYAQKMQCVQTPPSNIYILRSGIYMPPSFTVPESQSPQEVSFKWSVCKKATG